MLVLPIVRMRLAVYVEERLDLDNGGVAHDFQQCVIVNLGQYGICSSLDIRPDLAKVSRPDVHAEQIFHVHDVRQVVIGRDAVGSGYDLVFSPYWLLFHKAMEDEFVFVAWVNSSGEGPDVEGLVGDVVVASGDAPDCVHALDVFFGIPRETICGAPSFWRGK